MTVPLAPAAAFALFAERFNSWWPGHHIGAAALDEAIIEPRSGGRWYERGVDGSECDWGIVLDYDPPARLLLRHGAQGQAVRAGVGGGGGRSELLGLYRARAAAADQDGG